MGQMLGVPSGDTTIQCYEAVPKGVTKGALLLIHEIWGLNDHTKSVADRFAAEGYYVLAPSLLSEIDIADHAATLQLDLFNPEKRNEAQPKIRALTAPIHTPEFGQKTVSRLKNCFEYLYNQPSVQQKVAVCGFCFGGSYSYSLAMSEDRLKAAVPYYGHVTTEVNELRNIHCPILAFYGEKDENLMATLPELKEAMKTADVNFEAVVYPNCGHAFFNDTNPYAYNEEAASDAWRRTLSFLETNIV